MAETLAITIGVLLLFGGISLIGVGTEKDNTLPIIIGSICCISSIFVAILIYNSLTCNTPQAIDVYRGKTTLEITYRDSIPVDSVVVFKDK